MDQVLSRTVASEAVGGDGWRFLLGTLRTTVPTDSLAQAAEVAALAVATAGDDADGHLRADLRPDRVVLTLQSVARAAVTDRDAALARRISAAIRAAGRNTAPGPLQLVEIAIDARATSRRSGRSGRPFSATPTSPAPTGPATRSSTRPGRGRPWQGRDPV